mmetsp:Transcript_45575/g.145420  ORF Transcript_45575/g.145420 Transcript_45575/m.145420 type:complete len:343 (-) Transcript_45575:43-1071(-)
MKAVEKLALHERRNVGDLSAGSRAKVERDIGVLARQWRCPFIVELFATFQTEEKLYYVFEYCSGGELFDLVRAQPGGRVSEEASRFYAAEIVLALEHLHSHGIVHRDVRLENVLLSEDGHAKLADFGGARPGLPEGECDARPSYVLEFGEGTTEVFYPPEYVGGKLFGKDLDCWQLGVAIFSMLTGRLPNPPPLNTEDEAAEEGAWFGELPDDCTPLASDLCRRLLARERAERLGFPEGASELRTHGFFEVSPSFWQEAEARELPVPQLAIKDARSNRKSSRWARPTLPNWDSLSFLRISGFSFVSSTFLRGSRSVTSVRSRGGWSLRSGGSRRSSGAASPA